MNHIMIDIETMGLNPGAAIASIAAVQFDILTGKTGGEYYQKVCIESCQEYGLKIEASTVKWWMTKSDEAKKELFKEPIDLIFALGHLHEFITDIQKELSVEHELLVWATAPRIDFGLLIEAFNRTNIECPWLYRHERDARTIACLNWETKKNAPNVGTAHNALDDCKYQIGYLSSICRQYNLNPA
jgi:hypothetical protein